MADQEEDFSSLPLTERFVHKIWKVRKQAYEDAAKSFEKTADESDPAFKPFLQDPGLWKGAVADSNVAAQQDGVAALCSFLKYGGPHACTRTRHQSVPPLVEKGLPSTRAATKTSSLEALLLYIELDAPGPILEELIPFLSHKTPKVIAATLSALTAIYHAYGCKTIDPKPVLKALPKAFGHADKNVRAESQNLAVELYRWLKEALKPLFWGDLKPVQQQDLEKLFEKVKEEPPPKQERFLRSQQEAMAAASAAGVEDGEGAEGGEEEGEEAEVFDLAEPVDVIPHVPKDLYENLGSTKWKDRKDALDGLFTAVNVPRIKESDFNEIMRSLAKCMKDANIAVVTTAANCVEAIAKGLRRSFAKYRSTVMSPMMERLKEKKTSVTDALGAAIDAIFGATSLSECLEETIGFLTHKNPQVKLESAKFLIRCLRNTKDVPSKAEIKTISDSATKLLTESSEVLRSAAAEILGTLMKILGERAMNPYTEGLDEIRKTKIKEYFETAQVKAKEKPKAKPAPAPAAKATGPPSGKRVVGKKPAAGGLRKPSSSAPQAESPSATPSQPKTAPRGIPSKLSGPSKSGISAPGSGLKPQRRLGGAASSPKRPEASADADEPPSPAGGKFGPGRGLAGRPLGRPGAASMQSEPSAAAPVSGLGAVERAELEELRAEKERTQRSNEELRSERSKLTSQIHEFQNQNAQLIEDHTRDVLSIKAKETQLVRARSDAEAAEQMCQKQQREIERLKRELSRAVRASSPTSTDVNDQIYRDSGMNGSVAEHRHGPSASAGRPTSLNRPSFASTLSEEKENGSPDRSAYRSSKLSPPLYSDGQADLMSRPPRIGSAGRDSSRGSSRDAGGGGGASAANGSGEGIETWKRAAEVTSRLKARIEQMKVTQGINKPS
ncbi:MAG: hypothetical protein M4579_000996 [Chaenotheca gracillima]|nr:MAG: hypothetical protein M4579_000996 [Chaenotheca gracillima]